MSIIRCQAGRSSHPLGGKTVDKEALIEKIRTFPTSPGVYLMKDKQGRVLYVGKSVSLRDRALSYFRGGEDLRQNVTVMLSKVADVGFVETPSEVDALLAESRLIKDLHPRYNIDLKDDKSYPYIEIRREEYPRVIVSRDTRRGSVLYGPFTDVDGLRSAFTMLQKIFKFRVCSLDIRDDDPKRFRYRPCLYYYIGSCTAPCAAKISSEDYHALLKRLRQFLDGKHAAVVASLQREMDKAAAALDFETAARYRDQLRALDSLAKRGLFGDYGHVGSLDFDPVKGLGELARVLESQEPPRMMDGVDIATILGSDSVGSVVTFVDGRPFKDGYRRYKIKHVKGQDDYAMIAEVVYRRYRRLKEEEGILPHLLVVDGGPGQLAAALSAVAAAGARPAKIVALAKREELIFVEGRREPVELPRTSIALKILQAVRDEAHRFARQYHHILRDKDVFGAQSRRIVKKTREARRLRSAAKAAPE